jgi:glycosyltransferase involved in cell wall biosynthesis
MIANREATSIKVLHVYQDFYPKRGGIEDHILTLCRASSADIHNTVLTSNHSRRTVRDIVEGVSVIRVGSWGRYYTPFCPTMPLQLRQIPGDVIHIHLPCPMAIMAYLLARPKAALVIGYHNDIVQQRTLLKIYRPFLQAALRRAKRILVGTTDYLHTSPMLANFRDKCTVVSYGIEPESFDLTPSTSARTLVLRKIYPGPIVLFVGRICYYKGLEYLIPAMREVAATLLIVGVGPLERAMCKLVKQHGLTERVHLVGAVSDSELVAHYHASDVLVLPSTYRSEAFGLVQLQAQACRRPVISTDLPGVSTVNIHGFTGLVVPPRSSAALAEAINHLLSNRRLRQQMGIAGRRQVEEKYQAITMVERIRKVYEAAIQV